MVTLPASSRRVPEHTAEHINQMIRHQTIGNIAHSAANPGEIERRLDELDREWDVERMLETNASSLILIGLGLGLLVDRKWMTLPVVVASFLLQHGLQGWCPPLPILRRMGFRTRHEIDLERYAIKIIRGDFKEIANNGKDADKLLQAIEH